MSQFGQSKLDVSKNKVVGQVPVKCSINVPCLNHEKYL